MNGLQSYCLRVSIGLDAFIQSWFRFGTLGITISSRSASAAAHGHRWGLIMWWILDRLWPFGKDPVNGRPHCKGAVESDIARAQSVIAELQGDGTLQEYLKKFP